MAKNIEITQGICSSCGKESEEVFNVEGTLLCEYHMRVEGYCQTCGDYIPLPNEEDDEETKELNDAINDSNSDFAPTICISCYLKNNS